MTFKCYQERKGYAMIRNDMLKQSGSKQVPKYNAKGNQSLSLSPKQSIHGIYRFYN